MAKHRLDDLAHRDDVDAQVGQHAIGRPLLDPEQSEQQMLSADVRVMGALGLLLGEGQAHFGLLVETLERVHRATFPQSEPSPSPRRGEGRGEGRERSTCPVNERLFVAREPVKLECVGSSLDLFAPATRDWFRSSFDGPTQVQERGWQEVASGRHVLMAAPTGSGKTLAAFLWCLDRLTSEPIPVEAERCRVLYVSPMKALAHDVDRNLRSPLVGLRHQIEAAGAIAPDITVAIRTGDTPTDVRRSVERHPTRLLTTTPESLFLLLTSAARRILASVRWVIVDEIHSVAATKRGSHLALSLERLCALTKVEPQPVGLSATQRPPEEGARFLGGAGPGASVIDAGPR